MSSFTKLIIGLAALVVLWFITNSIKHDPMENDLAASAQSALSGADADWADVRVDGRRATLTGTPPTRVDGDAAVKLVGAVSGMFSARGDFAALETISPYLWIAKSRTGSVTLSGVAPSNDVINGLIKSAKATFPDRKVINQMRVANGVPGDDWSGVATLGLAQLGALETGTAKLQDSALTVSGTTSSPKVAANVKSALAGIVRGYTAQDDITVDLPSVDPAPPQTPASEAQKAVIVPKEAQAEIDQCQSRIDEIMTGQTVEFRTGSAEVFPQPNPLIIALADVAKECPSSRIEISGHTDSVGDPAANQKLSQARAQAIVNLLVDQSVPAARLRAQGFGAEQPIADNSTPDGRSANRRIEFKVLYAGAQ